MAASAPPVPSRTLDLLHSLLRVLRRTGAIVLGLVTALGALTNPQSSLLLGAGFAALGWLPVRLLARSPAPDLPPLPHPAVPATWMAVLPAAVAGTATLGLRPVGVVGATLAVTLAVGWWGGSCADPHAGQPGPAARPGSDDGSLDLLLRTLPVEALFEEWRDTAGEAVGGGSTEDGLRVRDLLIAELCRRDPVGAGRWLVEAPEDPPDDYIREPRDRAS